MILGDIGPHWHGRDLPPPPKCFKWQKTDIIKNTLKPQKKLKTGNLNSVDKQRSTLETNWQAKVANSASSRVDT